MSEIPEDLKDIYEQASSFSPKLGDHETVDGMIVRLIERIAKAEQASADYLKELEGLRADVKSLEESLDAQFAKFEGCPHKPIEEGLCGCSFDRIGDVCAHHAPALAELRAQLRSKDEQLAEMRDALGDIELKESATIRGWYGESVKGSIQASLDDCFNRLMRKRLAAPSGPSPAQEGTEPSKPALSEINRNTACEQHHER